MEHELKTLPEYFQAVKRGDKPFELRLDDRPYAVGDTLLLREYTEYYNYTGEILRVRVTYILRGGDWLTPGYVAMGVRLLTPDEHDPTFVCAGCGRDTHIRMNGLCLACVERELTP